MRTIRQCLTCFGVFLAGSASAQTIDSMQLANHLGSVLASEEKCGLTFNQAAIEAYVTSKVKADDMSFPSTLEMMTTGQKALLDEMSPSSLTAHCAQVRRVAKSNGFTE